MQFVLRTKYIGTVRLTQSTTQTCILKSIMLFLEVAYWILSRTTRCTFHAFVAHNGFVEEVQDHLYFQENKGDVEVLPYNFFQNVNTRGGGGGDSALEKICAFSSIRNLHDT